MRFTIVQLLAITFFIAFMAAVTFIFPPGVSGIIMIAVVVFVIPPFVLVNVIQAKGVRQAFFIGAMVGGTPHFIMSVYAVIAIGIFSDGTAFGSYDYWQQLIDTGGSPDRSYLYMHAAAILIGCLAGCSGVTARWFLATEQCRTSTNASQSNQN